MGAPIKNSVPVIEEIERAVASGMALDGYPFPSDPPRDQRYKWIRAMHQEAKIPDILTRQVGLSSQIRAEGVQAIPEKFHVLFPISFGVGRNFPPTALLHGDADVLVEFEQSTSFRERLSSASVKVMLERVQGAGHGFDVRNISPRINIDDEKTSDDEPYSSMKQIVAFLDKVVAF